MTLDIILQKVRVSRSGQVILKDVDWRLIQGERWVLAGANGAGKTTLMKLTRGDIWPDQLPGGGFAGERLYVVDGCASPSPIEARGRMGLGASEMRDRYRRRGFNVTARSVVVSGLTDSPLPSGLVGPRELEAAEKALTRLSLAHLADRLFLELSQGQAMSVLLARALVRDPEWLLLDEAMDGLDAPSRRKFLGLLESLNDQGLGLVLASHNLRTLPKLGFLATILEGGQVAFQGRLEDFKPKTISASPRPGPEASPVPSGPPLIEAVSAGLSVGGREVLADITWKLNPGENWAVFGLNGAGKSSFIKLLAGEAHPSLGRICRFSLPEPVSLWDLRARLGNVAWDIQAEYPRGTTVLEAVLSGFFGSFGLYETPGPDMRAVAETWLERLGLAALADRAMSGLSQGQARKVVIGRALVHDPQVLLLDEPLGGLDVQAKAEVLSLLDDLAGQGRQLVMATHNPWELPAAITHGLVLNQGRVAAAGPIEEAVLAYTP
jgi:molybdate transport system ATP-binding protein